LRRRDRLGLLDIKRRAEKRVRPRAGMHHRRAGELSADDQRMIAVGRFRQPIDTPDAHAVPLALVDADQMQRCAILFPRGEIRARPANLNLRDDPPGFGLARRNFDRPANLVRLRAILGLVGDDGRCSACRAAQNLLFHLGRNAFD
jgi:hypothetical protein